MITEENFEDVVLKSEEKVLIDFYADWCGPCKMMSPIIDSIKEERSDIKVYKINVDEEENLARRYGIMSIPTLIIFDKGEIKEKIVGLTSKDDILEKLK